MKTPHSRLRIYPVAGLILLAFAAPLGAAGEGAAAGMAYDLESGELLYRETHCLNNDGSEREVFYQDIDGKLIAHKRVDYSSGVTTPSFVQHNHNASKSIEVGMQQGEVRMTVFDWDSGRATRSAVARPKDGLPVVIDAGFDGFVRQHWNELVSGETREFQFPFANRESLVQLRIQPRTCSYQTQSDQCFRLDLANWLLRMMVEPIELGYDLESRRLARFRGLSNISDEGGNGLVVDIHYSYRDVPAQACENVTCLKKFWGKLAWEQSFTRAHAGQELLPDK